MGENRPQLQQSLMEVLYTAPHAQSGSSAFNAQRLIALLNGALGSVARGDSSAFVDLDTLPEDAVDASSIAKFLLSDKAKSLWAVLRGELMQITDLLIRQVRFDSGSKGYPSKPEALADDAWNPPPILSCHPSRMSGAVRSCRGYARAQQCCFRHSLVRGCRS